MYSNTHGIIWTPKPQPVTKNAVKKLYQFLLNMQGYKELPLFCRYDYYFLSKWVNKYHPNENKAKLILKYLTGGFE